MSVEMMVGDGVVGMGQYRNCTFEDSRWVHMYI